MYWYRQHYRLTVDDPRFTHAPLAVMHDEFATHVAYMRHLRGDSSHHETDSFASDLSESELADELDALAGDAPQPDDWDSVSVDDLIDALDETTHG